MVHTYIMLRARQDPVDGSWGPHSGDLSGYNYSGEDATARASKLQGPLFLSSIQAHPRIVIWKMRVDNQTAIDMASQPNLWLLTSQLINQDGVVTLDTSDDVFTTEERATRINQLAAFTDFDRDMIENWWTPDKTRYQVAKRLREYLGAIN